MDAAQSEGSYLQPGQLIRPKTTSSDAKDLIHSLYGLTVTNIKELNSYDDKNFHIKVSSEHCNPHIQEVSADGYVFKVLNCMDSHKTHVEAEHEAERLCQAAGVVCPVPVLNLQGHDYSKQVLSPSATINNNVAEENVHIVRLLTFVPGCIFYEAPYTPHLIHSAGSFLGQMTNVLKDFTHPSLTGHTTVWNLISAPKLTEFLYAVTDDKRKSLVNDVINNFSDTVIPRLIDCNKGVIHGDFNEQNIVIATKDSADSADSDVVGVIDFGDMTESYYVFEVAIAIMYMMVESKVIDPMLAGGHFLAGYLAHRSLNPTEWNLLKSCVAARYCQSLVMGAYSYSLDPGNEYLLVTAANGWPQLQQLWQTPADDLYESWKKVIDSYNI